MQGEKNFKAMYHQYPQGIKTIVIIKQEQGATERTFRRQKSALRN